MNTVALFITFFMLSSVVYVSLSCAEVVHIKVARLAQQKISNYRVEVQVLTKWIVKI